MSTSTLIETPAAQDEHATLFVGFELGKATWLIGLYAPELGRTVSRYKIDGGDLGKVLELIAAMRRMSALSPKIQELREKYKDDPTRMNSEVMKLYKEYGINPVGGCLPMLIQIPIFFGLFTMLRQAVELRGAHFLWIRDLSQPDTVAHLPIVGWPINILPLIMAATSFWMTHLTPKSGDPTQQRMMMFMPIIFIVFCYNFAAALALYYTVQNLFSILQLYQNRKQPMPTLEKVAVPKRKRR